MRNRLNQTAKYLSDLKEDPFVLLLIGYLLVSQVYYSYRYLLGYGSTATSQIVKDTPIEFQLGKYLITLVFYLAIATVLYQKRRLYLPTLGKLWRQNKLVVTILMTFLIYIGVSLLKYDFNFFDFAFKELVKAQVFIPVALVAFLIIQKDKLSEALSKILILALGYQIVGFIITYFGFVFFGKLPAQSYPGQFIRFGGIWDDPNAFGLFLLIPLFLILALKNSWLENHRHLVYLTVGIISAMLFLSLSLTSWIAMVVGLGVLLFLKRNTFMLKNLAIIAAVFIVLGLVSPYSRTFVYSKIASLQARVCSVLSTTNQENCQKFLEGYGILGQFEFGYVTDEKFPVSNIEKANSSWSSDEPLNQVISAVIGKKSQPTFNENYYLALFFNYGAVGLGLFLTVLLLAFRQARGLVLKSSKAVDRSWGYFSLSFLSATSVGMMALPYPSMYPINIYIWLVVVLLFSFAAKNKISLK